MSLMKRVPVNRKYSDLIHKSQLTIFALPFIALIVLIGLLMGCASTSANRAHSTEGTSLDISNEKELSSGDERPELSPSDKSGQRDPRGKAARVNIYIRGGDDWTATWEPVFRTTTEIAAPAVGEIAGSTPSIRSREEAPAGPQEVSAPVIRKVQGFRVQLANVLDKGQALWAQERANAMFDSVYIVFRSPNYKVRAGDFRLRSEADDAATRARAMGFRGAWVVPSRVIVRPVADGNDPLH